MDTKLHLRIKKTISPSGIKNQPAKQLAEFRALTVYYPLTKSNIQVVEKS